MQVYIIAHGNEKIGMGHIMRTLSLAEAFRECAHEVSFFCRYKQGMDVIKTKGFDVEKLPEYNICIEREGFFYGTQEELDIEINYLSEKITTSVDLIVVDSYNVTSSYLRELRKFTQCLAYIDDLNAFSYPVDILINGTASAYDMRYEHKQTSKLLIGMDYNLLRREFIHMPLKNTKKLVSDILITTGNSDPFDVTGSLLRVLLNEDEFGDYKYHVIVGGGFDEEIWKKNKLDKNRNVFLHHKPSNMAEIMLKCDLAITAGGSTVYELAACGIPMIAFSYAENQVPQIKALANMGVLLYMGHYDIWDDKVLVESIKDLEHCYERRREITAQLQSMVDGLGVYRVVEELERWMI